LRLYWISLSRAFLKKNQEVIVLDKRGKRFEKNWLENFKHKNLKIILDDIKNFND